MSFWIGFASGTVITFIICIAVIITFAFKQISETTEPDDK